MASRPGAVSAEQSAIIGRNVRTLRLRRGWTMAQLGELMGWQAESTVCSAEGARHAWQRRFTPDEVGRLAGIFGVSPEQLNTRCVNCKGCPDPGFGCLACGAATPLGNSRAVIVNP